MKRINIHQHNYPVQITSPSPPVCEVDARLPCLTDVLGLNIQFNLCHSAAAGWYWALIQQVWITPDNNCSKEQQGHTVSWEWQPWVLSWTFDQWWPDCTPRSRTNNLGGSSWVPISLTRHLAIRARNHWACARHIRSCPVFHLESNHIIQYLMLAGCASSLVNHQGTVCNISLKWALSVVLTYMNI